MEPIDSAPDSWEQEDDSEAPVDVPLRAALGALNVHAAEFVPGARQMVPTEEPGRRGELAAAFYFLSPGVLASVVRL